MRIAATVLILMVFTAGLRAAAQDPAAPFRPSPQVLMDPQAFYSPLLFRRMADPKPGEWRAEHPEPDQTFQQFAANRPLRPTVGRHTIYLAPLGPMTGTDRGRLEVLRQFLELYYCLPARMGRPLSLDGVTSRERTAGSLGSRRGPGTMVRQYLSEDILHRVLLPAVPQDAVCLQAVTMEDLYPEPSWNYVFGQALLSGRVAVYSLVRFYPAFWGMPDSPDQEKLGFARGLKLLVHETGHVFGVAHCQTYECAMNGTNSLQESDPRPIHLCPECLKKFRWNIGFDMIKRYEGLLAFYSARGMEAEAVWVQKRLRQVRGEKIEP